MGGAATAGAVELILRMYELPLGIENFVVFWRWEWDGSTASAVVKHRPDILPRTTGAMVN